MFEIHVSLFIPFVRLAPVGPVPAPHGQTVLTDEYKFAKIQQPRISVPSAKMNSSSSSSDKHTISSHYSHQAKANDAYSCSRNQFAARQHGVQFAANKSIERWRLADRREKSGEN